MISIRRTTASALLFAVVAMMALPSAAEAEKKGDRKPDATKGQALAGVCAGCHGADGISPVPTQPNLAGMSGTYIAKQLQHFKTGQRDNAIMKGFAANLSADDMKDLGAYFAAKPTRPIGTKDEKLAKTAEKLYRAGDAARGIPACSGCHSPTGAGIPAQYPRIGGQHAEYTLAQLTSFRTGKRGGATKEDPNSNGKLMASIAAKLTDAEVKALSEYTAGLKAN
ncbi:c-type cytochrome [Casimicrobium huifangae]|jgi:cytochrome c553|uniref:c-type cytochrome n=1 Tax=Casimicrobium huifangae TaxID=2591109 RepID=UPI0012ECB8F9|nr:c-type cytochrome [Casimicrobium huifangae]